MHYVHINKDYKSKKPQQPIFWNGWSSTKTNGMYVQDIECWYLATCIERPTDGHTTYVWFVAFTLFGWWKAAAAGLVAFSNPYTPQRLVRSRSSWAGCVQQPIHTPTACEKPQRGSHFSASQSPSFLVLAGAAASCWLELVAWLAATAQPIPPSRTGPLLLFRPCLVLKKICIVPITSNLRTYT